MRGGKAPGYTDFGIERHNKRRIGAEVTDMGAAFQYYPAHALRRHLGPRVTFEGHQGLVQGRHGCRLELSLDATLADHPDIGQPHAIGRQDSGEGMQQHLIHTERVGHGADMLAGRGTEAAQRVVGDVVAALGRDNLDGVGHVVDGNTQETFRHGLGRAPVTDILSQVRETLAHHTGVERRIATRPKDMRKHVRLDAPEHDIAVGHRKRATTAITGWTRISTRRVRPDTHARAVEMQDRATTGRHRMDAHHRRADAHPGDDVVLGTLICAIVVGDVGRGTTHVEADDLLEPRHARCTHGAHYPACGPREDRILTAKTVRVGESTIRLHEHQSTTFQLCGDARHVTPENGREVSIRHGGIATAHKLH